LTDMMHVRELKMNYEINKTMTKICHNHYINIYS